MEYVLDLYSACSVDVSECLAKSRSTARPEHIDLFYPRLAEYDSSDEDVRPLSRSRTAPARSEAASAATLRVHTELCRFLTRVLCSLPFKKEEEPLFVISEIGKQLHLYGGYADDLPLSARCPESFACMCCAHTVHLQ